jgi:type IV pilus assembly protein PilY1
MFVGTNDGALRLINTNDGTNHGTEEWAVYFPEFLANQGALMDDAQNVHLTGVDGTPTAYVIDNNNNGIIEPTNNDKVYIYVGERRGGRNIYAFDVTPDTTLANPTQVGGIKPKFLWRIRGGTGNFGALGQTWSRPALTKIRVKSGGTGNSTLKTVLIFAGGYDPQIDVPGSGNVVPSGSDSMGNAIYIVDPLNGALVWSMGVTGSGANLTHDNMKYAIPSDLALMDTNGDGATDRIYVGDSRGQIWRIDLGDQIDPGQAGTGGSKAYVFADVGCSGGTRSNDCSATSRQQHHMFFYPPDVAQARDALYSPSKPDYDLVVVGTGNREDPLDKLTAAVSATEQPVHNRIYAFRDYNFKTGPYGATAPTTLTETDLYDATANNLGTLTGAALQTEITNNVVTKKGWFIKLMESTSPQWIGEKVLAKPVIFGGQVFVTTFVPTPSSAASAATCQPLSEGSGRLYVMNYLDATAIYDFNSDGAKDRQYTVGGGIPSEAVIVIREGGVTTLIGTSGGAAHPPISMSLPRYQTYWYEN